jgi:hypothetical protein
MTDAVPILSAEEILKATEGVPLRGGRGWSCRGVSTDTRTLTAGNLFIALAGENFDGHGCLIEAAKRGAAGLLIRTDAAEKLAAAPEDLPAIGCDHRKFRKNHNEGNGRDDRRAHTERPQNGRQSEQPNRPSPNPAQTAEGT